MEVLDGGRGFPVAQAGRASENTGASEGDGVGDTCLRSHG